MNILPACAGAFAMIPTGKAMPCSGGVYSNTRLPTDPLFYADITLQNIVTGSRYWISEASDISNVLSTGVAASSSVIISTVPAYSNPMLVEIRVRNSSNIVKYQPLVTYGYLYKTGMTVYVAQVADGVLNG